MRETIILLNRIHNSCRILARTVREHPTPDFFLLPKLQQIEEDLADLTYLAPPSRPVLLPAPGEPT